MNAIRIRTGLAMCAHRGTCDALPLRHGCRRGREAPREKQANSARNTSRSSGHENHYANNPRQAPPNQDAAASSVHGVAAAAAWHAPGCVQHAPGYNGNGNGNHYVIGPPRGPQSPNYHGPGSNIVPPPRYANQPGHGYPPGYNHSSRLWLPPGYGHPPYSCRTLPVGYHRHYWNGNPYYYDGGHWYRPYGSSYVVVGAPYGLFVSTLPYYSSFWYGSTRYYYSDGVYYNYDPTRSGYVVAHSPYGDEQQRRSRGNGRRHVHLSCAGPERAAAGG